MTAEFSGEEIIELTTGRLAQGIMPDEAATVTSDTRTLQEGQWFIALPGPKFDGHDFIGDAYSAGALGCIVEERGSYPIASTQFPLIAVDDTHTAFQQLARNWRKRINPRVIAVSASPTERSHVVELCEMVLQKRFRVLTHNDGDAQALLAAELNLTEDVQVFLTKVCPRELAQCELIGKALSPTVVVLTEEGFSHLRASSEFTIARAECDLIAHLDKGRGVAVISKRAADLMHRIKYHFPERSIVFDENAIEVEQGADVMTLRRKGSDGSFQFPAEIGALDAWSVITTLNQLGMSDADIQTELKKVCR